MMSLVQLMGKLMRIPIILTAIVALSRTYSSATLAFMHCLSVQTNVDSATIIAYASLPAVLADISASFAVLAFAL
jgi:hypothetical protein